MTSDTSDPLAAIAAFYDLDLDGLDDDVAMYADIARRCGSYGLELGGGTGRVGPARPEAGAPARDLPLLPLRTQPSASTTQP